MPKSGPRITYDSSQISGCCNQRDESRYPDWYFGMDVRTVAWGQFLPQKMAPKAGTGICLAPDQFHRDQRVVLFTATAIQLSRVVRGHAGEFPIFCERGALRYAH